MVSLNIIPIEFGWVPKDSWTSTGTVGLSEVSIVLLSPVVLQSAGVCDRNELFDFVTSVDIICIIMLCLPSGHHCSLESNSMVIT